MSGDSLVHGIDGLEAEGNRNLDQPLVDVRGDTSRKRSTAGGTQAEVRLSRE